MNKHEQVIYIKGCLYHGCLAVCTDGFTQDPTKHIPRVQLLRPVSQRGRLGVKREIPQFDHPYPAAQITTGIIHDQFRSWSQYTFVSSKQSVLYRCAKEFCTQPRTVFKQLEKHLFHA